MVLIGLFLGLFKTVPNTFDSNQSAHHRPKASETAQPTFNYSTAFTMELLLQSSLSILSEVCAVATASLALCHGVGLRIELSMVSELKMETESAFN